MSKYKNLCFKPSKPEYGPEFYETDVKPTDYRGYLVYERIKGSVWDVVKDDVCITQMAGMSGAKAAIDAVEDEKVLDGLIELTSLFPAEYRHKVMNDLANWEGQS